MSKLHTRASIAGASLSGANTKGTNLATWDALNSVGVTDQNRTTVTASTTLLTTQCGYLPVDCTGGNVTLTLPTSGTASDEAEYRIRRLDATSNTLTIQRGGADTIEGGTSFTVGTGQQFDIKLPAGATDWKVLNRGGGTAAQARAAHGFSGGVVIDRAFDSYTTNTNLTTTIPADDTIPQNTEGTQVISIPFTPKSVNSRFRLRFQGQVTSDVGGTIVAAALFSSASASAIKAAYVNHATASVSQIVIEHEYVPGVTTALTFSVRVGPSSAANVRMNGASGGRIFGGAMGATLTIEEITP